MAAHVIFEHLLDIFHEEEEEHIASDERFNALRLERNHARDTSDPFTLPLPYFKKYYRLTPEVTLRLVDLIKNEIIGERNSMIPIHIQVLITMRFLAERSLQKGFSQDFQHPVSQATASRCINRVTNAINRFSDHFVQFPANEDKRELIQNDFQRTIRIPGIIGIVDGFIVKFKRPTENEEAFFNYRHGTSMNVQIIVDSNYSILNIRVCPGSNNDRFVWQLSEAKEFMEHLREDENIVRQYYILGDSGYTPSSILLTPILDAPEGSAAFDYTSEFLRTRCKVEQTIGMLTSIWRVINRSRTLSYSPEKVAQFINSAAILHNFRIKHGIPDNIDGQLIDQYNNNNEIRGGNYVAGIAERNGLIRQYYM